MGKQSECVLWWRMSVWLHGGSVGTYTVWLKLTCRSRSWLPCRMTALLTGRVLISAVGFGDSVVHSQGPAALPVGVPGQHPEPRSVARRWQQPLTVVPGLGKDPGKDAFPLPWSHPAQGEEGRAPRRAARADELEGASVTRTGGHGGSLQGTAPSGHSWAAVSASRRRALRGVAV